MDTSKNIVSTSYCATRLRLVLYICSNYTSYCCSGLTYGVIL
ncbi:hypothetical protein CP523_12885 [Clostridium septicum]|uniref:PTS EIIB type-1 domain-containing protein n=1 Tax=Clostridium septicum TaxID=1504 RepID=A0A9N7JP82_CLOSE|nr:hypothetical protein CP523_12885 [Clostridium septicum]QAS62179.1 hypothetical protein EI377_07765 [Clostridium septicum]UEC22321.1 PTS transporter subunit EIIB [Clostridium septicum]